jgi:hypothetical protein
LTTRQIVALDSAGFVDGHAAGVPNLRKWLMLWWLPCGGSLMQFL